MFEHADDCFGGRLDILINNAGIAHHGAFLELSFEDWERVLRNNLTSAFLCAQGAARIMAAHGGGRIVNIGSISGQRGSYGRTAYGVTKAGIHQMTRIMAVEARPARHRRQRHRARPHRYRHHQHGPGSGAPLS